MSVVRFVERNWLGIVVLAILSIFIDWKVGYYSNAMYGTKFDISSCWAGLTTIGSAGFLAGVKYLVDSWLNSNTNEVPSTFKRDGE